MVSGRFVTVALLASLFPGCLGAAADADAADVRIASYNVRVASKWARDDGFDKMHRRTWEERRSKVAKMIEIASCSVVGSQEGLGWQLDELIQLIGPKTWRRIGVGRVGDGTDDDETAGILYDSARLALVDSGDFWLSETPEKSSKSWGASLPRLATWAVFQTNGRKFAVLNTHFDHQSATARRQSARLLRERALALEARFGAPVFVTGDFNADKTEAWHDELVQDATPFRLLQDGGLVDAWSSAAARACGACAASTYHAWRGAYKRVDVELALSGLKHIDGIFATRSALAQGEIVLARM
ncbi:Endonuclease/exonuclease/phosphatase, partial [Pelagophyceae sp. CCMP2097]